MKWLIFHTAEQTSGEIYLKFKFLLIISQHSVAEYACEVLLMKSSREKVNQKNKTINFCLQRKSCVRWGKSRTTKEKCNCHRIGYFMCWLQKLHLHMHWTNCQKERTETKVQFAAIFNFQLFISSLPVRWRKNSKLSGGRFGVTRERKTRQKKMKIVWNFQLLFSLHAYVCDGIPTRSDDAYRKFTSTDTGSLLRCMLV